MNIRFLSIVIAAAAICVFLVLQATQESRAAVLIPSELLAQAKDTASLKRIRVGGKVAALPIEYSVDPAFVLKFSIINPGKNDPTADSVAGAIPVVYEGIRPDMFTVGRDVIIDGEYTDGVLQASKLLTQCPSKYEPPSPDTMYKK